MNRFYTSDDGTKQAFSWQCNLGAGVLVVIGNGVYRATWGSFF